MISKYIKIDNINFNISKINKIITENCDIVIKLIKKKNKKLKWMISYINYLKNNQNLFLILFFSIIVFFSSSFLNLFFILLLFDSIIIALILLHKKLIDKYSRKLSKNIITLALIYFNFFGSTLTLILFIFVYFEFSKYINKIIYKILETIICFINTNLSIISIIYPDIINIDYNKPIESTEETSSYESTTDCDIN